MCEKREQKRREGRGGDMGGNDERRGEGRRGDIKVEKDERGKKRHRREEGI